MENTAAILISPGDIQIQKVPIPDVKEDEVLIRVEYVGICGSDIHAFKFGPYIPPVNKETRIGLGHECSGEIINCGKNVSSLCIGDKVVIEPGIPCGKCKYCLEGHYNLCIKMDFLATQPNYRGALTEYISFPERSTFKLPENINTLEAALIEPAAVGLHAALKANVIPGKNIVILGGGFIGMMTMLACKLMGVSKIIVVDILDSRLNLANSLGASQIINSKKDDLIDMIFEYTEKKGADIVFETAGSAETAKKASSIVARGGRIMIVGTIAEDIPINFLKINKEITIQTVFRYANTFPLVIDAIASGRLELESLISKVFNYSLTQDAFKEITIQPEKIFKAVINVSR